ncbi:MAG: hypothetical protein ACR2HH_06570 [Chthoniobacterales bacterium]
MDNREARALLSLHRAGEVDSPNEQFREAAQRAADNPELARWWADDQASDVAIGRKLQSLHVPAALKERLLAADQPIERVRDGRWRRRILLAAAAIIALAVVFGSWRGPFQPAASLADYRDEMASFVQVPPSLEMKSNDLSKLVSFLQKAGAPSAMEIPPALRQMEPIGCRRLRFRGYDVALVCFKRAGNLVHMFVIDRAAVAGKRTPETPQFAPAGEWMTASWEQGGQTCVVMMRGEQAQLEQMLATR